MDFLLSNGLSAELSVLTGLLDRVSLPFLFFAVSCSKEHVPPFEHDLFDVQDRQSLPFSLFFEKSTCPAAAALKMSFTIVLNFW